MTSKTEHMIMSQYRVNTERKCNEAKTGGKPAERCPEHHSNNSLVCVCSAIKFRLLIWTLFSRLIFNHLSGIIINILILIK